MAIPTTIEETKARSVMQADLGMQEELEVPGVDGGHAACRFEGIRAISGEIKPFSPLVRVGCSGRGDLHVLLGRGISSGMVSTVTDPLGAPPITRTTWTGGC